MDVDTHVPTKFSETDVHDGADVFKLADVDHPVRA